MRRIPLLAGAVMLLGVASAHAQGAPDAPPPPPGGPGGPGAEMPHPPMGGPPGFMGMHHGHMAMMQRAAAFRFVRDGAEIEIKCAAAESTRACVDAAAVLIDKIAAVSAPK